MSEIDELMRTRSAQNKALEEVNVRIYACKQSMDNYEALAERLETLPDKLSHEVMVPFGKLAFMPGKIVHTNELMVHLGDTWFASMTCKQALKTIERRKKNLQDSLADFEKISKNIENKNEFYQEMENMARSKNEVEIKEECPSTYKHPKDRRRISRVKEEKPQEKSKIESKQESNKQKLSNHNNEDLMKRLDELERLEKEEDELCRLSNENTDSDDSPSERDMAAESASKHVTWKDEGGGGDQALASLNHLPSCDDSKTMTIKFRHSKTPSEPKSRDEVTPGDIYKLETKKSKMNPKSILKKSPSVEEKTEETLPVQNNVALPAKNLVTAVSDTVVERSNQTVQEEKDMAPKRPVSRFKAGRKKL